ncbi:Pleiotropic regulatory protein [Desulfamplus magnetovallimortis]|uniref:Pleiotropic regulatory protein n=1 Tax=Desulfamplus magnetovallimortis TaxID=1246637 RepID=A0A1W1HDB6_9BACT|nr:DegT/DnrJ/EryC1/StrS family aminotransferase [Desulfamplus magnetovallimortis]SLM30392.1 Pleiotropic regulatory protein [Desulfamplus magnetovallimortis]
MKVPFVLFDEMHPFIKEKVFSHFNEIYDSGFFINGRFVRKLESAFADYCGRKYAVACSSGLAALHLATAGMGLRYGHEVICPTNTFAATALAAHYTGASVSFADIDPETLNMDLKSVEERVTSNTKAVMAVHMYGNPVDMGAYEKLGIPVIEDAAHAHGGDLDGRKTGSLGLVSCFSFFQTKNMGGLSDGGMVLTDDAELAEKMRILHDVGQKTKHDHIMMGFNYRMSEFNAAFLLEKLKMLDQWNDMRIKNASMYNNAFEEHPKIKIQKVISGGKHVYHLYVIRVKNRDILKDKLAEDGIVTEVQYPVPIHRQKPWIEKKPPNTYCELPEAEDAAREILSLPVFSGISEEKINYVISRVLTHVEQQ